MITSYTTQFSISPGLFVEAVSTLTSDIWCDRNEDGIRTTDKRHSFSFFLIIFRYMALTIDRVVKEKIPFGLMSKRIPFLSYKLRLRPLNE